MDEENDMIDEALPNEAEFAEAAEASSDGEIDVKEKEVVAPLEKPQTPEPMPIDERAFNASERRKAEQEKLKADAVLEAFKGIVNPFTGEEIKDSLDVNEYKTMLEIQRKGGDPVADYANQVKAKEREVISEKEKAMESDSFIARDSAEFIAANPNLDMAKLFADKRFNRFVGTRVGKDSMSKIYEDWIFIAGEFEQSAKDKAQTIAAKAAASPGSLSGGSAAKLSYETMPDSDFDKKLAAVLAGKETI